MNGRGSISVRELQWHAKQAPPSGELPVLVQQIQQRKLELEARNLALRLQRVQSRDEAAHLYNELQVGFITLDEHGIICDINPAAATLLRSPPSELIGKRLLRFIADVDVHKFLDYTDQCVQRSEMLCNELRLHLPGGEITDVQALFQPSVRKDDGFSVAIILEDITFVKRTQEEVSKLAAFATQNPEPVLEFSGEGRLEWFNDAAMRLAQSLGADHPSAIIPENAPGIVRECLTGKGGQLQQQTHVRNQRLYWTFFAGTRPDAVHCYVTKTKDESSIEAKLHFRALESAGQIAARLAHDFNNVLAIIQGYTSLLLSQTVLAPEMADPLRQIANAAERATNLTRQLMAFSRKQILEPQPVDLNELIQNVALLMRRVPAEAIEHRFVLAPDIPLVRADPTMLEQIVVNLVANAQEAMPGGGVLTFSTSALEVSEDHPGTTAEARPGKFACFCVTDTGKGMTADTLNHIFEPFFTTKQSGLGLGLSTVHGMVAQHQGWIEVSSRPGEGSTFKVVLPTEPEPAQAKQPKLPVSSFSGNETIMVVEDEPVLRELVSRQLRKYGYRIYTACSGTEALAVWPEHVHEIDLLFTDIVMPDNVTGRDLAETLQAQKPDLKVVYTSGYTVDVVEQEFAMPKGANFLQKPYQPEKLAEVIRRVLDQHIVEVPVESRA